MGKLKDKKKRVKREREIEQRENMTNHGFYVELAARTGFSKKELVGVFKEAMAIMHNELVGRGAPGQFTWPFGVRLRVVNTKERVGRNPHTREKMIIPAKSGVLRVRALKKLKDELSE